ncbi:MAG: MFS transporter [Chloroflexota bacterium]
MAVVETAGRYRWVILALVLLCQSSGALAGQALAPLAPLFQSELGLTKAEVGIFSSATYAGAWCVILIAGTLTDRFGIRRMMSLGQVATGGFLLAMASVGSLLQAAAVMFAAGVARGTIFPGSTKAILEWFPPAARATAMGLKQTGAPIAGVVTAATLPALGLAVGWRFAIATVGVVIIAIGILTIVLYRDAARSERSTGTKPSMRAGLKGVIRNRGLWSLSSVAMLYVMAQQGLIMYLALYLKEVVLVPLIPDEGARIVAAGGYLAVCQMGGIFGRVFWGMVSDRLFHGRRMVVLALVGFLAVLMALVVARLDAAWPLWLMATIAFAAGASSVGWNGVYHALITETVGRTYAATGVGFSLTMIEAGTTLGPPLFGFAIDVAGSYQTAWHFLAGLSAAGTLMAILSIPGERHVA